MSAFTALEQQQMAAGLDSQQQMLFQSQFAAERKDRTTILVLSVLLGGLGADRFMVGDMGLGLLKLFTGGLFGIMWLIDIFLIGNRVDEYNRAKALEIATSIRAFSKTGTSPTYGSGFATTSQTPPSESSFRPSVGQTEQRSINNESDPEIRLLPTYLPSAPTRAASWPKAAILVCAALATAFAAAALYWAFSARSSRQHEEAVVTYSDGALAAKIQERINRDPILGAHHITAEVYGGNLTLTGRATNDAMRAYATELLRNESGIRTIANDISLTEPEPPRSNLITESSSTQAPLRLAESAEELPASSQGTATSSDVALSTETSSTVNEAVRAWRAALLSNDPSIQARPYARAVQRYFLASDWSNSQVQSYLQKVHNQNGAFTSLNISQMSIDPGLNGQVEVRFVKDFSMVRNGVTTTAVVRSVLHLVQEEGEWKINYERDFKS